MCEAFCGLKDLVIVGKEQKQAFLSTLRWVIRCYVVLHVVQMTGETYNMWSPRQNQTYIHCLNHPDNHQQQTFPSWLSDFVGMITHLVWSPAAAFSPVTCAIRLDYCPICPASILQIKIGYIEISCHTWTALVRRVEHITESSVPDEDLMCPKTS